MYRVRYVKRQSRSRTATAMRENASARPPGLWRIAGLMFTHLLLLAAVTPDASAGHPTDLGKRIFRIGTGGEYGTYFPVGSLIAEELSRQPSCAECLESDLIAVSQLSSGSLSNVEALARGALEAALVQADIAHWAYTGTEICSGKAPLTELRAVASLYPESIHLVARNGSGIEHVSDLKGRQVALDEPGSGTLADVRIILKAYDMEESDLRPHYIKPEFAAEKIANKELDAFFIVAGHPARTVAELAERGLVHLVPLDEPHTSTILAEHPFFSRDTIPAGTYSGITETTTLSVSAQLVVRAEQADALIYRVTRMLWSHETQQLLQNGTAKGAEIRLESALRGSGIPLHTGAERYYREAGMKSALRRLAEIQ